MAPPGYWMHETGGLLRPAVEAYLRGDEMGPLHVSIMRAYLCQWIAAECWQGPAIEVLRAGIDGLVARRDIERWLDAALDAGIDPL